jgi:hypothetical protein
MWDQYKTQLPLIYSLYPDISDQLMRTILAYCRAAGRMPHILLLDRRPFDSEDKQAQMLAEHTLLDAYIRGVPLDLQETARQIRCEVMNPNRFADYKASGVCDDIAHTIDVADGCKASERLAEAAGDKYPVKGGTYCKTNAYPSLSQTKGQNAAGQAHPKPRAHIGGLGAHCGYPRAHRASAQKIFLFAVVLGAEEEIQSNAQNQRKIENECQKFHNARFLLSCN